MNSAVLLRDFHTHRTPPPGTTALQAVERLPSEPGLYSLMLHPWQLPNEFAGLPPEWREQAAVAAAVGEVGLDRLRGPEPAVQQKFLAAALATAAELGKPVVFHCVRCRSELLAAVRPYPEMRKLLHGFAGGVASLHEYIENGFAVSLGRRALARPELGTALRRRDIWRHLGLESDDEPGGVAGLLHAAEELAGMELAEILAANFTRFVYGDGNPPLA